MAEGLEHASRSMVVVVLVLAISALTGCGSGGDGGGTTSTEASSAAVEHQIQSREQAALPKDPKFVGKPTVKVNCSGSTCKATLTSDLATNIPLGEDRWTISGGKPELQGGSNIVGFMAADAAFGCMNREAAASSTIAALQALKPCSRVVAHKKLP
jgi:hypothetical protein